MHRPLHFPLARPRFLSAGLNRAAAGARAAAGVATEHLCPCRRVERLRSRRLPRFQQAIVIEPPSPRRIWAATPARPHRRRRRIRQPPAPLALISCTATIPVSPHAFPALPSSVSCTGPRSPLREVPAAAWPRLRRRPGDHRRPCLGSDDVRLSGGPNAPGHAQNGPLQRRPERAPPCVMATGV